MKLRKLKPIRILSLVICLSMLFGMTSVFALDGGSDANATMLSDTEINTDVYRAAEDFLAGEGKDGELITPVALYNMHDELEAICFDISTGGFLSVNVKNYHVFDYSPDGKSEAHEFLEKNRSIPKFYTNGAMCTYYDAGDETIIEVHSGTEYAKSDFVDPYDETAAPYVQTFATYPNYNFGSKTMAWKGTISGDTRYMCVPISFAIFMEYYQTQLLANSSQNLGITTHTRNAICSTLTNGSIPYVINHVKGQNWNAICPGGNTVHDNEPIPNKGMNAYLKEKTNNTGTFYRVAYNWNNMTERLRINKPLILLVYPGTSMTEIKAGETHACVVVGYTQTASANYFYINDGWGNNQRKVEIRGGTMPEYIFLG